MTQRNEDYLIHITTGTHVAQICLYLLNESNYLPGRLLQTSPSTKRNNRDTIGGYRIIDLDLSRYNRIAMRFRQEIKDDISFLKSGIETRNTSFNNLIAQIEQVAVNCATLRGDGAMSALFGHKKRAFTGAASDRDGLLKSADKGLLFLDEVGELGLDEQSMLLRAVEKKFREDLLARINLWTFEMPGLNKRPEDIGPNLNYELERFAEKNNTHITFSKEAETRLLTFAKSPQALWPANFRDLNGAVTRMATLAPGGRITGQVVKDEIARLQTQRAGLSGIREDRILVDLLGEEQVLSLDRFEKVQLADVINVCRRSKTIAQAGRVLFASSRARKTRTNDSDRLRKYLSKYKIQWTEI